MSSASPALYAREKLSTLRRRWDSDAGAGVRSYGPRVWPNVPPTALMGLTASSEGPSEAIGDLSTSGSAVGLFGVEGPNVRALATDEETIAILGRPARVELTPAGYLGDINGQVVTGLLNYSRHLDSVLRAIPSSVWESGDGSSSSSSFILRVAVSAYSAGPGITTAVLRHYAAELALVPIRDRWAELGRLVSLETATTIGGHNVSGRYGVAFLVVRAEQRLESGLALDNAVGGGRASWFASWVAGAGPVVDRLVQMAYGGTSTHGNPAPSSGGGGAVLLALALVGAWMFWGKD